LIGSKKAPENVTLTLIMNQSYIIEQANPADVLAGTCPNVQGTDHSLNRWFI